MNLSTPAVRSSSKVTVTPADPTATGSYELGLASKTATLDIDQVFSVKGIGVTAAGTIDLLDGTVTFGTGTVDGGTNDADGQAIGLAGMSVLHIRNTSENDIHISLDDVDGEVNPISSLIIPGGTSPSTQGEIMIMLPTQKTAGILTIEPAVALESINFDVMVMGKQ